MAVRYFYQIKFFFVEDGLWIGFIAGLKCHACEGSGLDDPCMLGQHNNDSNIVTCEPNEFCHIQRTVTLLNVTENENGEILEL